MSDKEIIDRLANQCESLEYQVEQKDKEISELKTALSEMHLCLAEYAVWQASTRDERELKRIFINARDIRRKHSKAHLPTHATI